MAVMSYPAIRPARPCLLAITLALTLVAASSAHAAASTQASASTSSGQGTTGGQQPGKADASATVEQCLTALTPGERSATFVGEMTATPATARMEISIGLLEHAPGEGPYRAISAPGLGAWRGSAAGVKTYTYIKQVTDLAAPAFYRGDVRFRWLNDKGRIIKSENLRTPRCEQPATPASGSEPSTGATTPAGASTTPSDTTTTAPTTG
jgi:hypothetical protein